MSQQYEEFYFLLASCLPWIPEQGTVGASGDLAPLAHLALGLMGEGKMWSDKSGWADAKLVCQVRPVLDRQTFHITNLIKMSVNCVVCLCRMYL